MIEARIRPEGTYFYWDLFIGQGADLKFHYGKADSIDEAIKQIKEIVDASRRQKQ